MFGFLKSSFQKIKSALGKTRSFLSQRLRSLFSKPWNEETFEQLEQILFEADLGSECATAFVEHLPHAIEPHSHTRHQCHPEHLSRSCFICVEDAL